MKESRLWLALVVLLFCLPLYVGLGRTDLEGDEAIYSFAVDHILEAGDWLAPRSSPSETKVFLEKPPLKFWIVAAPIGAGLLPHNEFGLRFWDALFGAVAFLYVYAIGSVLAGPLSGTAAVLVLFTQTSLLFVHGLRSNNMEAALVLAYCGGLYHVIRWEASRTAPTARGHALCAALYFTLGFMTKFVAILFLPLIAAGAIALNRAARVKFGREHRLWVAAAGIAVLLCAPWFVYAASAFGRQFWRIILQEQVVARFTASLEPSHRQPWWFYFTSIYRDFFYAGSSTLAAAGLVFLAVQTVKRRWFAGTTVLLWLGMPLTLMSFGTSKLYHYAYPVLPPLSLAAGYAAALVLLLAPAGVRRLFESRHGTNAAVAAVVEHRGGRLLRIAFAAAGAAALLIAGITVASGEIEWKARGITILRNGALLRPLLVAAMLFVLAVRPRRTVGTIVVLAVMALLPLSAYGEQVIRLTRSAAPMRSTRDCLLDVESREPNARGLYVSVPHDVLPHDVYYYFRRVRPWLPAAADLASVAKLLDDPTSVRPTLIAGFKARVAGRLRDRDETAAERKLATLAAVDFGDVTLLLPEPYGRCAAAAAAASGRSLYNNRLALAGAR